MRPANSALVAALLLAAASWAAAKTKPRSSFDVPAGWSERGDDARTRVYLSDGSRTIDIQLVERRAAERLAPELYGGKPAVAESFVEASTTTVAGRRVKLLARRYTLAHGAEARGVDYVYEEIVVVPGRKGTVWTLDFKSPSAAYIDEPHGFSEWRALLKTFKPR